MGALVSVWGSFLGAEIRTKLCREADQVLVLTDKGVVAVVGGSAGGWLSAPFGDQESTEIGSERGGNHGEGEEL